MTSSPKWITTPAAGRSANRSSTNKLGHKNVRLHYLIRQEHFSEEEKRLHTHKPRATGANHKSKVKNWVAHSGGINSKALAIYSYYIKPYERLRQIFADLLEKEGL